MEGFKRIVVLQNEHEAKLMDDVLSERDIPHRIRSYHDSALDGLFQITKGWGHVEAPEEYRDEIKGILSSLPGKIIEEDAGPREEDAGPGDPDVKAEDDS
jgi:hypothetical protein